MKQQPWPPLDGVFQWEYLYRMTVKTSITLSEETLKAIDREVAPGSNRSRLIETALREWLAGRAKAARDERELRLLNRHAADFNRETAEALEFQVKP